jgi:hypothetical protein
VEGAGTLQAKKGCLRQRRFSRCWISVFLRARHKESGVLARKQPERQQGNTAALNVNAQIFFILLFGEHQP